MISMKSASSFFIAAAVTAAAVTAAIYTERKFRRRQSGDDSNEKKLDLKDGSQESLVNERFQACAKAMGPHLSRLPQQTQLDYYALFKQGTLGNCREYQSGPPPSYDLVATAKYQAWIRLDGMDRMTAMQNYVDKAIHFQFTKHLEEGDDDDCELEGDPVIGVWGLGDKPSTLLVDDDKDATELQDSKYPIHAAAREGKLEELKKIIEEKSMTKTIDSSNAFPNTLDDSGQTPLHLATDRGHIDCVKALILAGANINSVDNDGISILQAAVIGGDEKICKVLLALGADPDQADNDGDTPRDSAQDDTELIKLFENYDKKSLSAEDLLDPEFLKELQGKKIPVIIPLESTSASDSKPEDVDLKTAVDILDKGIDFDLDDDEDMF